VEADRGQIEQVLLNLFVNAAQAMPQGGELHLQTENATLKKSYVRPYKAKPGRYVKIVVADTGEGMDEEIQNRIFDPFFTTRRRGRGSGLGLASAYGIIRNHEGIIEVASTKGKGATFTIHLPASAKKATKTRQKRAERPMKGARTILLVDDEEIVIRAVQANLLSLGYAVVPTNSGEEAIAAYKKERDSIDLVILDMIMPGMGGGATYEGLKEIDPEVKVLLASGYSLDGQALKIIAQGCDGFIQKPFETEKLSLKIREILGKGKDK
jgi:CheY-like chemotaxis protein